MSSPSWSSLGYAAWVGLKYRATRKLEREFPPYPTPTTIR